MAQAAVAPRLASPDTRLRELGVYALPDGREYVVSTLYADGCALYSKRSWDEFGGAEYWADRYGRLISHGEPTRWRVEDLMDTGRTTVYPHPSFGG